MKIPMLKFFVTLLLLVLSFFCSPLFSENQNIILYSNTFNGGDTFGLIFSPPLDLQTSYHQSFLRFQIKFQPDEGTLVIALKDTSLSNGRDGYSSAVELVPYISNETNWQDVIIPMSDFPRMGENLSLPASNRFRPFDWTSVGLINLMNSERPSAWAIRKIEISEYSSDQDPSLIDNMLVTPIVDLSSGEMVSITAKFDLLTKWKVRIIQGSAVKTYSNTSIQCAAEWNGDSDKGVFREGVCDVHLIYNRADNLNKKKIEKGKFYITSAHAPRVRVSQLGYFPDMRKVARVSGIDGLEKYKVVSADSKETVFSGVTSSTAYSIPSGEFISEIDFSPVTEPGRYFIDVDGVGKSFPFDIGNSVYTGLANAALKSFYYQRCGEDLPEFNAGIYKRKACHTNDAFVYQFVRNKIEKGVFLKTGGGWHDAGDFGKKVVSAADALGYLLSFCELFPDKVKKISAGTPGSDALPDMLKEIRYELNWFLSMQNPDGGVWHLLTSADFFTSDMPDKDNQTRYLTSISSCATADLAAVMAKAARVFTAYDPVFSARCLRSARYAWNWLEINQDIVPRGGYKDPKGIHGTGAYEDDSDADERFWAACELFVTTEEFNFEEYIGAHYLDYAPLMSEAPNWKNPRGFGLFSYVLAGKESYKFRNIFMGEILMYADKVRNAIQSSPYSITTELAPWSWNNTTAMETTACLIMAGEISGRDQYVEAALGQFEYVLGANPLDISFVSGFGIRSVHEPFQAASLHDGIEEPIPGFLVPGPNLTAEDPVMVKNQTTKKLFPLMNYLDSWRAYSVNEVNLVTSAPFLFVAAFFDRR